MGNLHQFSIDELKQVPFVSASAWTPDRYFSNLHFFVKDAWHCWLPFGEKLHKVFMQPVEADYFGDKAEKTTDRCFRLFDLIARRASFAGTYRASRGIWNDFQNLATSLAKLNLFFEASLQGRETSRFAVTEVEYIVLVCRSIFDLLQEVVGSIWQLTELTDKSITKKALPKSFRDVLFHKSVLLSAREISRRFGLPNSFSDWYVSQENFFTALRAVRDRLAHLGSQAVEIIFTTKRGYAIRRQEPTWSKIYDWPKEVELENDLVPLRPVLHSVISRVVQATDSFAQVLETTIRLPGDLYPGLSLFSRGYHDGELEQMEHVLKHSWWCDTRRESAVNEKQDASSRAGAATDG